MPKTPLSVLKFRLIFSAFWIVWACLQVIVLLRFGVSIDISLTDSVITNSLLAATCILISNNLKYYLPQQERYWYIFILSVVLSGICCAICRWILIFLTGNINEYLLFLTITLPVRFGITFLLIACMAMISVVWYTFEEQKENEKRKNETSRLSKEAELYKLRQQLQPHFLFNSLNSISALIVSRPEQARTMIQQLSDFLRSTLKNEEQQWTSLLEELQYLELYLSIEKVRFGHRLNTIIESDENSRQMKLPNMLLQPIVENAIKFGLYDTMGEVLIRINASATGNQLIIFIENPFDPGTSISIQGTGFGLTSVQKRLQLVFARQDLLVTSTQGNLFTTTIKIPQQ